MGFCDRSDRLTYFHIHEMNHYPENLETGDIFFCRDNSWRSRLTARVERHRGEGPSLATHTGVMRDAKNIAQAQADGIVIGPLKAYMDLRYAEQNGFEWCVVRHNGIVDPYIIQSMRVWMDSYKGMKYSWIELGLCGLDWPLGLLTGHNVVFFRYFGDLIPARIICSKFNGMFISSFQLLQGDHAYDTPDDLWDAIWTLIQGHKAHHWGEWMIVDHSAKWLKPLEDFEKRKLRKLECIFPYQLITA